MIDLYYWPTPNGHKVSIFLEETATPYRVVPVNIRKGEQFAPDFLKISPNNRMPAIVDTEGPGGKPISIFESGAILLYLGEKTGKFLPSGGLGRYSVIQWLMFQMGGVGPMFGQAGHFRNAAPEKISYAIERYTNETHRLCDVMNKRLADAAYLGGDYSIADMATYPWVVAAMKRDPEQLNVRTNLKRWVDAIGDRPAVKNGMAVMADTPVQPLTEEERSILYGNKQFEKR
jgi:GSH-dependent disulfide-bond oxidoreductase